MCAIAHYLEKSKFCFKIKNLSALIQFSPIRILVWLFIYIYNIFANLPRNFISILPYPRSWDSHGQETFLTPSADKLKPPPLLYYAIMYYTSYIYAYIYMAFITEWFLEAAIESWPEWDLNPRPLNSVQTL